jgi:AcrR family transcriptional regulator
MPRGVSAAETRDRLLLAAAQLLDESGNTTVSTRAICERAGVEAPTLYHHFGNKQGLIDAVLRHGFNQYVDAGRQDATSIPSRRFVGAGIATFASGQRTRASTRRCTVMSSAAGPRDYIRRACPLD